MAVFDSVQRAAPKSVRQVHVDLVIRELDSVQRCYETVLHLLNRICMPAFRDRYADLSRCKPFHIIRFDLLMGGPKEPVWPCVLELLEHAQSMRPHVPEEHRTRILDALEELERFAKDWDKRYG